MDQSTDDRVLDEKIQQLTKSYMARTLSKKEFESRKKEVIDSYSPNILRESTNNTAPINKYSNKYLMFILLFFALIASVYLISNIGINISFIPLFESLGRSNIPIIAAFFIGIMTAISPCPLATNITAIAYTSKKIGNSKHTFLVGILYTIGRAIVYIGIAAVIVWIGISTFSISLTLQKYGKLLLGPLMLLFGILMLNIFNISFGKSSDKISKLKEILSEKGLIGSLLLGMLFAIAFCPISAVFYFGMLIPLAIQNSDPIIIPSVFAIATGLPVIIFSLILVFSFSKIGNVMKKVQTFEKWMRTIVALIFISVGIYYIFIV